MSDEAWRKAIENLSSLWELERAAERERDAAERRETTLSDRVARGRALSSVEVSETSSASGGRTMLWLEVEGLEDFRSSPGAPLVLWHEAPDSPTSLRGVLARRRARRLGIMVDDFPDERFLDGSFNVDVESPQVTYQRGARALRALLEARPSSETGRLARTVFGELREERLRERAIDWFDQTLNDEQRAAVSGALHVEPIVFVHGPPGTGKTRTLVELVRQFRAEGKSVLVCAASNAAVDNICERLIAAEVELVRLGHPGRVSNAVESRTLDALLEARPDFALARGWMEEANAIRRRIAVRCDRGSMSRGERRAGYAEARQLMRDARDHLRRVEDAILASTHVVACTLTGAETKILGERRFDVSIVDEASQAPDPLLAIALGRAPRIVLAGDPNQLPPTVIDTEAARRGLERTTLERHVAAASLLKVQHRMHDSIMRFPSESKYEGRLEAHPSVAGHTLTTPDPLRPGPLVLIDTAGKGWNDETSERDASTRNPGHAERTAAEVQRLLGRGLAPEEVAVITPYYAQVRLLRELLPVEGLEIDTVDGFQGREKEAVVVDLVRSNERGEIGFLADTRRMNVALTRARRFLLVVADSATIGGHPYYSAFLAHMEEHGAWVSAWSDDAPPFEPRISGPGN